MNKNSLWFNLKSINHFNNKTHDDFFLTEKTLVSKLKEPMNNILDLGCASGRFIELLQKKFKKFSFTGVDIVPDQIELAKKNYPKHTFFCRDILKFKVDKKYDLVNSTGVLLHEPNFEKFINLMLSYSNKYIMFDIKLAKIKNHLIDISKSYCDMDNRKLPYILYAPQKFFNFLSNLKNVNSIFIFGYNTNKNKFTTIPNDITKYFSVGILLEKNKRYRQKKIDISIFDESIEYKTLDFLIN